MSKTLTAKKTPPKKAPVKKTTTKSAAKPRKPKASRKPKSSTKKKANKPRGWLKTLWGIGWKSALAVAAILLFGYIKFRKQKVSLKTHYPFLTILRVVLHFFPPLFSYQYLQSYF